MTTTSGPIGEYCSTTIYDDISPSRAYRRTTNFGDGSKLITERSPGRYGEDVITSTYENRTGTKVTTITENSPKRYTSKTTRHETEYSLSPKKQYSSRLSSTEELSPRRTYSKVERTEYSPVPKRTFSRVERTEYSPVRITKVEEETRFSPSRVLHTTKEDYGFKRVYRTVTSPTKFSPPRVIESTIYEDKNPEFSRYTTIVSEPREEVVITEHRDYPTFSRTSITRKYDSNEYSKYSSYKRPVNRYNTTYLNHEISPERLRREDSYYSGNGYTREVKETSPDGKERTTLYKRYY